MNQLSHTPDLKKIVLKSLQNTAYSTEFYLIKTKSAAPLGSPFTSMVIVCFPG